LTDNNTVAATNTSKFNYAADFEYVDSSSNEYLSINDNAQTGLDITGEITVAGWFNIEDNPSVLGGYTIASKFEDFSPPTSADWSYRLYVRNSDLLPQFTVSFSGTGADGFIRADNAVSTGSWHHAVGTYDGNYLYLYIDNELATAPVAYSDGIYNSAASFSIGGFESTGGDPVFGEFDGQLDEIRVYDRALSPSEVADLYNWAPGPVGHWKMEENATAAAAATLNDSSGQENALTTNRYSGNYPETVNGKYGKAIDPSLGTADHNKWAAIADGSHTGLDITDSITVTAWVKPYQIANCFGNQSYHLVTKGQSTVEFTDSTQLGYRLIGSCNPGSDTLNGVQFIVSSDGTDDNETSSGGDSGAPNLTTGNWHHFVGTYDGSTVKAYLDGTFFSSASYSSGIFNNTGDFRVGGLQYAGGGGLVFDFPGIIDDVRVYNYARTQQQIVEDMNAGHPAPGSPVGSPVLHLNFDEGYGDTANDSSPQDNDGNLAGGTSCPQSGDSACPSWSNNGKFGKALDWEQDGVTDDYVEVNTAIISDYPFTASVWAKTESATNQDDLISLADSSVENVFYSLEINAAGYAAFDLLDGGSSDNTASTTAINDTNWHHIVGVFTSSTERYLYVDGIQVASSTTSISLNSGVDRWHIGQRADSTPSNNYDGLIDEVAIYNSALTQDQIKLLYNQTSAAVWGATSTNSSDVGTWSSTNEYCPPGQGSSCTAPIAEWKFDEKVNTSAYDTSENNNTGTLTNGPEWRHAGECKHGACLFFDGASGLDQNDIVNAGTDNSIDNIFDGGGTVSAWVYPQSEGEDSSGMIIEKGLSSDGWFIQVQPGTGNTVDLNMRAAFSDPGNSQWRVDNILNLNEWSHIVIIYDDDSASNDPTFYVNGIEQTLDLDSNMAGSYDSDESADLSIGSRLPGTDHTFDGLIDQVRMYDYERTASQIAWEYNRGGPIGHWQLDECSGNTAYDIGNGGNNGTITIGSGGTQDEAGTCLSGDTSHAWNNGTTGKVNYSLNFDGNDDYISIGDIDTLEVPSEGKLTIAAWVNRDTFNSHDVIYSKTSDITSGAVDRLVFYISAGDGLVFIIGDGGNSHLHVSNREITQSGWYHVVVVFENTDESTFYVNGVADDSGLGAGFSQAMDNSDAVVIGAESDGGYPFSGQIDDIRVYNYVLTQEQIRDIYNQGSVYFGPSTGHP